MCICPDHNIILAVIPGLWVVWLPGAAVKGRARRYHGRSREPLSQPAKWTRAYPKAVTGQKSIIAVISYWHLNQPQHATHVREHTPMLVSVLVVPLRQRLPANYF